MRIPEIWKGQTCYIVGGGPSLTGFDWSRLKGKNVIAINCSLFKLPWPEVALFWLDYAFWETYKEEITTHASRLKFCITRKVGDPVFLLNLNPTGVRGLETEQDGLRCGKNSAYSAMNIAYHMGVNKIILMGIDVAVSGAQTHWHDFYGPIQEQKNIVRKLNEFNKMFQTIVQPLKDESVEVYNASTISKLECWPKITLEEALNDAPVEKVNS